LGFHEIQYRFLYEKLLSKCDFCGNWHNHSHILHTSVTEFSIFLDLGEIWYRSSPHYVIFVPLLFLWKSVLWRAYSIWGFKSNVSHIFYIFHPTWIKLSTGIVHINVLSNSGFCENWQCERHTAHREIN